MSLSIFEISSLWSMVHISQYIQRLAGNMQMTQDMPITDSMNLISIWKPRPKIKKKVASKSWKKKYLSLQVYLTIFIPP